eukprot:5367635-Amphidinium_carterae.1
MLGRTIGLTPELGDPDSKTRHLKPRTADQSSIIANVSRRESHDNTAWLSPLFPPLAAQRGGCAPPDPHAAIHP